MYMTAVWKRFWRLQNFPVGLEVTAPMTDLNTYPMDSHPPWQQGLLKKSSLSENHKTSYLMFLSIS